MKISFIGHSFISLKDKVKEAVRKKLKNEIAGTQHVICYLGGYGDFDEICAGVCRELKQEHIDIKLVYVTPYITVAEQIKIKALQDAGLYDQSIFPPIEAVPPKFAISKRNEWMMINADTVIAYVDHCYGGAYQSLLVAKRKKKKIIR